jgi:hypothetical protein
MALNIAQLTKDMLNAAKPVLQDFWKDAKPYAEKEAKAFAQNLAMIEKLKIQGKISKEAAAIHIDIQKNSFRAVLLTIQGLGILAVQDALNAAFGVIRGTVNKAIGWILL